jgi:hypothetical protein
MKFAIVKPKYIFVINMLTPLPDEQRAQGGLFAYTPLRKPAIGPSR